MRYKPSIVLLGMFLGSHGSAAAQISAPQIVLAQKPAVPIISTLRTAPKPMLTTSFPRYHDPGQPSAHFSRPFAGAYVPYYSLDALPPIEELDTLFSTQSSLPLVQLWSGRLRFDGFTGTLNTMNLQFGPTFRPPRLSYPGGPRSVDLYGVSQRFHFGGDARTGCPTRVLRGLSRFLGTVLE